MKYYYETSLFKGVNAYPFIDGVLAFLTYLDISLGYYMY